MVFTRSPKSVTFIGAEESAPASFAREIRMRLAQSTSPEGALPFQYEEPITVSCETSIVGLAFRFHSGISPYYIWYRNQNLSFSLKLHSCVFLTLKVFQSLVLIFIRWHMGLLFRNVNHTLTLYRDSYARSRSS